MVKLLKYELHSGGANGSDSAWGRIGSKYGLDSENIYHYYHGNKTPLGNNEITEEDFEEGKSMVLKVNKILKRRPHRYIDLLARNWCQIKYSTATYAIVNGVDLYTGVVNGGTGWAVAMSIISRHNTYIFNQDTSCWYKYDFKSLRFQQIDTIPVLTENFAGIGTRELQQNGIDAIYDVYNETIKINNV